MREAVSPLAIHFQPFATIGADALFERSTGDLLQVGYLGARHVIGRSATVQTEASRQETKHQDSFATARGVLQLVFSGPSLKQLLVQNWCFAHY